MRYLATIRFDGTAYHGWQIQPNGMSIQEKVQQCLSLLLRQPVEVVGAGRTDAGVHARELPCHFDYPQASPASEEGQVSASCEEEALDTAQLCYRLNRVLPADISCTRISRVADDLHARFSARRRTYRYFIHTEKDPFERHFSVETHWPLDFDLMNEGAQWLTTVNDFRAFCKAGADVKTTLCEVYAARWVQTGDHDYYFEIAANRFLRNMVRATVGTLMELGRHRITLEQLKDIVLRGSRSDAGESMPAKGLFLWSVEY